MSSSDFNKRKLSVRYDINEVKPPESKKIRTSPIKTLIAEDFSMNNDWFNDDFDLPGFDLDLTQWKRCVIEKITESKLYRVVSLVRENKDEKADCQLHESWRTLNIKPGDVITVKAGWDQNKNMFYVNSQEGYIVQNPDFLISGTSVTGSLFCRRKGVLSERFKGIDSGNKVMTIGSLVHELFQDVLKRNLKSFESIQSAGERLLNSRHTMFSLYGNGMQLAETREEISQYYKHIQQFMKRYVVDSGRATKTFDENFNGRIEEILDIEENVWIPNLGLKGKIDVTVRTDKSVIPLEVKTGKTSFSLEHTGQVGLYQTMMSELKNEPVRSGLLLYLKDGRMKEVSVKRNEQRDLIMLRNELSHYLTQEIRESNRQFDVPKLPEPISHHNACSKCPYNVICCAYLKRDTEMKISNENPLKRILPDALFHLTEADIDYFINWTGLVTLEHEQCKRDGQIHRVWTKTIAEREGQGIAIKDLRVYGPVLQSDGLSYHNFTNLPAGYDPIVNSSSHSNNFKDLTETSIVPGSYVIISIDNRVNIATGHVQSISKNTVTVSLERDLTIRYPNKFFFIDLYVSDSMMSFNLTNLGALMNNTEQSEILRKIIISKISPTFEKSLSKRIISEGSEILAKLNQIQRRAVLKAIAANEYLLLKGLAGTGKSQTLVALIELLVLLGYSVLVTSHTHSAVDNLLMRVKSKGLKFLRLGSSNRIVKELYEDSEEYLTENCKTPEDLTEIYNQYLVVGVTCIGSAHPLLAKRKFDVCIVDEATQVFQMAVIRPLLSAKKFILVGDPYQLPPIIRSAKARDLGADESLFTRLDGETATFTLTMQYRMNKTITKLANNLTYKGKLMCANPEVENATLIVPKAGVVAEDFGSEAWMLKTLSTHIDQSVVMLDTKNVFQLSCKFESEQQDERSTLRLGDESLLEKFSKDRKSLYANYCEAALVFYIVDALMKGGVNGKSIGVISPYRAQVDLLKKIHGLYANTLKSEKNFTVEQFEGVEVNTVDQYQGRDKDLIIYSCTKSVNKLKPSTSDRNETEILDDHRRLTVAITRAKQKLIVMGDLESLQRYAPFAQLIGSINKVSIVEMDEGRKGFSWSTVLNWLETIYEHESESFLNQTQV